MLTNVRETTCEVLYTKKLRGLEISVLIGNNDKKTSFCMTLDLLYLTIAPGLATITDTNCQVFAIMSTPLLVSPMHLLSAIKGDNYLDV